MTSYEFNTLENDKVIIKMHDVRHIEQHDNYVTFHLNSTGKEYNVPLTPEYSNNIRYIIQNRTSH